MGYHEDYLLSVVTASPRQVADLINIVGVGPSWLLQTLRRLERQGLVERYPDTTDGHELRRDVRRVYGPPRS